jgi:hypothetical protein
MPRANVALRAAVLTAAAAMFAGCSAAAGTTPAAAHGGGATVGAATSGTSGTGGGAAPSSSPGTIAATGKRDSCSMLTIDEVTAALGLPAAPGKPEPNFDTPECEWDPASGQNGTVTLDVGPWDGDPGVKPLRLGTPVSGIGDEAYDDGNTGLFVRSGNQGFRVWVFNVHTQSSRLDLEKQLAVKLLAELSQ